MELKQGYKQTEVGIIPQDWGLLKLENNFTLKARIGWQGLTTKEYLSSGNYSLVTGTDFHDGYINWESCVFVEKIRFDQDRNIQLKVGDVLVTKDGTIGKVAYVDRLPNPTTLNSGVFVIRPKNNAVNNRFFYSILMSFYFDEFLNKITAGSTITHLYQKDFIHFNFILPPLHEQTAIANALSDMDTLISQSEKLIEKKKAIKQGAMQELLKPKEGWVTKKLGEVISFQTGFPFSSHNFSKEPNGIRLIKNRDLRSDDSIIYFCGHYIEDFLVNNGDLLIGMDGDFEPVIWDKGIALLNQRVGRVKKKKEVSLGFLAYTLLAELKLIESRTGSTTVKHLSHADVENIELRMPDYKEQCKIDTALRDLTNEIDHLSRKLNKFKFQKQGMMQALLTGKIRLIS